MERQRHIPICQQRNYHSVYWNNDIDKPNDSLLFSRFVNNIQPNNDERHRNNFSSQWNVKDNIPICHQRNFHSVYWNNDIDKPNDSLLFSRFVNNIKPNNDERHRNNFSSQWNVKDNIPICHQRNFHSVYWNNDIDKPNDSLLFSRFVNNIQPNNDERHRNNFSSQWNVKDNIPICQQRNYHSIYWNDDIDKPNDSLLFARFVNNIKPNNDERHRNNFSSQWNVKDNIPICHQRNFHSVYWYNDIVKPNDSLLFPRFVNDIKSNNNERHKNNITISWNIMDNFPICQH